MTTLKDKIQLAADNISHRVNNEKAFGNRVKAIHKETLGETRNLTGIILECQNQSPGEKIYNVFCASSIYDEKKPQAFEALKAAVAVVSRDENKNSHSGDLPGKSFNDLYGTMATFGKIIATYQSVEIVDLGENTCLILYTNPLRTNPTPEGSVYRGTNREAKTPEDTFPGSSAAA